MSKFDLSLATKGKGISHTIYLYQFVDSHSSGSHTKTCKQSRLPCRLEGPLFRPDALSRCPKALMMCKDRMTNEFINPLPLKIPRSYLVLLLNEGVGSGWRSGINCPQGSPRCLSNALQQKPSTFLGGHAQRLLASN